MDLPDFGPNREPIGSGERYTMTITGSNGLPGQGPRDRAARSRIDKRRQALSVTGSGLDSNRERCAARRSLSVTGSPSTWDERRVICVAGGKAMSGGMSEPQGMRKRRAAMSVTGAVPQRHTSSDYGKNIFRETFSTAEARAAMGMEEPWDKLPMKFLSQAIPPVYGEWIGRQAMRYLKARDGR
jgi:hypothetical protein